MYILYRSPRSAVGRYIELLVVEVTVTSRATPRDSAVFADASGYDATWHTRLGEEGPQDIYVLLRIGNVR